MSNHSFLLNNHKLGHAIQDAWRKNVQLFLKENSDSLKII